MIMKRVVFTLGTILFLVSAVFSQEDVTFELTKTSKAVYFDVSEPLRDKEPVKPEERDRSWKDDIIQNEFIHSNEFNSKELSDPVVQRKQGEKQVLGPINNFEGTGNLNGVYPPDTEGDVGPNHYFQMINLSFTIYDKQGNTLYGPADNSTLWDGFIGPWTGSNDGDPVVVYDEDADRWVASQFAIQTSDGQFYELVAVSKTPDPTGEYYRYAFEYDNFNDYPKLSVWSDAYVATYNMFNSSGSVFQGAGVAAFDREAMLAGDEEAEQQFFQLSDDYYGMLPADFDGDMPPDSVPAYIGHMASSGSQAIQLFEFTIDWETPSNSEMTLEHSLEPEVYSSYSPGIEQPGTNQELDDFSGQMLFPLKFRKFDDHLSMVMTHSVYDNSTSSYGIRWYEVRNTDGEWNIYQQSTYAPDDDLDRWLPSIAMNGNGDIAVGYSVASEDVYPSIRYTARTADAPLGEMNVSEVEVIQGTSPQTFSNRWGDYATMTADPANDSTFWYTNEYVSGGWNTRIVSFTLDPIQPPVVDAGPDTTICEESIYNTAPANGQYTESYMWETSGDGNFVPSNEELAVNYLRGSEDVENGGATLTLTGYGYQEGMEDQDELYMTIVSNPEVNAGNDTTICTTDSYYTTPLVSSASMVGWSTSGDGSFENPSQASTVYYPGSQDIANGEVTLSITASPMAPCDEPSADDVVITFDVCTDVEKVKADSEKLTIRPNPTSGRFTLKVDNVDAGKGTISISNMSGSEVFRKDVVISGNQMAEKIDLTNLPDGVYLLKMQLNNKSFSDKIIIR